MRYDVDLLQGGRGSSAQADTNLLRLCVENGRNQKANFVRKMLKDRERHRKDRSNYHCRNRAPFDLRSVHFTMISMANVRISTG